MTANKFYAGNFHELSMEIGSSLGTQGEKVSNLLQGMQDLSTSQSISGGGADAMRNYIGEVHMSILSGIMEAFQGFQTAIGTYWNGYQAQDGSESFKFIKEDFDNSQKKLAQAKATLSGYQGHLQGIVNSISDIVSVGDAGGGALSRSFDSLETMRKLAETTEDTWSSYENSSQGFDAIEDLLSRIKGMVGQYQNSVNVSRGRKYVSGSFFSSAGDFLAAYQAVNSFCDQNAKAASAGWKELQQDYKTDVKREVAAEKKAQEEANRHKGFFEVVLGVGALVVGVVAIIATAGAAAPLVGAGAAWVIGGLVGGGAALYGLSNMGEGVNIMVTGNNKGFNLLRDKVFHGNQGAYDTFGNVSMFVAAAAIPASGALVAGGTMTSAVVTGVARAGVTTLVGVGTNFVVAPVATNLAKSMGADDLWANDIGTAVGIGTSLFTGREAYKASGVNWVKAGSGDFSGIKGSTYEDAINRVPKNANNPEFTSTNNIKTGNKFNWTNSDGSKGFMEAHSADSKAPAGSNASNGWITRIKQGNNYFDPQTGKFMPRQAFKPNSPSFDPDLANRTHIPIQPPVKLAPYAPNQRKEEPLWNW